MVITEALNIPVQLYAACSTTGDMTPVWFRYETAEHTVESVKIEKIYSHREERFCGAAHLSFICDAVCGERRRLFELRYNIDTHKWSLFRVLS